MNINKQKLAEYIDSLKNIKVLVVGDLAIDEMIYGDTERISREAPVLILQHTKTNILLGAAANAAHNASVINGGKVGVIGVTGDDYQAGQLRTALEEANIDCSGLVAENGRKTVTKTRISGSCSQSVTQQIVRIDRQTKALINQDTEKNVIHNLEKLIPKYDAIILSDYHIGVLTQNIIDKATELANKHNKVIVVDAQKDLDKYNNVTSMTPNLPDTQKFTGIELTSQDKIIEAGKNIIAKTNCKSILITCGADGMISVNGNGDYDIIPAFNRSRVFDVTGAGDTVTALYSMGLATGAEPVYAAVIGNLAASIVVKQFGCATTSIAELLQTLNKIEL
ncbi:bifunctional hydroxymethylpyrimidine kinase/phosphomethylpyrimidine kinase [bacterium]|nr:bifunctional hydroxymethylpyrimidine kinase/phosphomethylpyrimidine kinase [bacterium]